MALSKLVASIDAERRGNLSSALRRSCWTSIASKFLSASVQIVRTRGMEHADPPHSIGLLRARRERPRSCRAAEERDELAPPDAKCHLIPPAGRATEG